MFFIRSKLYLVYVGGNILGVIVKQCLIMLFICKQYKQFENNSVFNVKLIDNAIELISFQ